MEFKGNFLIFLGNKTVVFDMRMNLPEIDGFPTDIVADTNGTLWMGIRKSGQVREYIILFPEIFLIIS